MTTHGSSPVRLSTLDFVFSVMDSVCSPLDFSLVLPLGDAPDLQALQAGARSARNRYPTTGSYMRGNRWIHLDEPSDGIDTVLVANDAVTRAIERFVDAPFSLLNQTPVRQLLISTYSGNGSLVTRFHHAAADGLSAAMWLDHQLGVAYGGEKPEHHSSVLNEVNVKRLRKSVRTSKYAHHGRSDRLWTPRSEHSGARRWITIGFPASELRRACRQAGGFTYNDLLATCALETFGNWNRLHSRRNDAGEKVGLWLPINIRKESALGFGNGTSRIRVYAQHSGASSIITKARAVRTQVSWCIQNGEWVVPNLPGLTRMPRKAVAPIVRSYLNRGSVDMATGVFSHANTWPGRSDITLQNVERIECIGLLHPSQCLAINGLTHRKQTWLTFTYDPGLLCADDVQSLSQIYQQQIALAKEALACEV